MELVETKIVVKKNNTPNKKDRRSSADRRKSYSPEYFLKGGKERRSGRERRFVWDMTM